jgi:hypothetical protein
LAYIDRASADATTQYESDVEVRSIFSDYCESANKLFRRYYGLDESVGHAKPNGRRASAEGLVVHQKIQYDNPLTEEETADDHAQAESQPTLVTGDEPNDEAAI